MRDEKNETIADIVAEIRGSWAQVYFCEGSRRKDGEYCDNEFVAIEPESIADRIEAAWKRELEAGAEASQICGEIGEAIGRWSSGNAAKMRETLEFADSQLRAATEDNTFCEDVLYLVGCMIAVARACRAALAAPPRNCDIYDAESCRMAYHFDGDGLMTMQAFADWLFAPVPEGGVK